MNPLALAQSALEDAQQLLALVNDPGPKEVTPSTKQETDLKSAAELHLYGYRLRERIIGYRIDECAWAILIDLYVNEGRRNVSVSSACTGSGYPSTTALRQIVRLIDRGLICKNADPGDLRRYHLTLAETARQAAENWLQALHKFSADRRRQ